MTQDDFDEWLEHPTTKAVFVVIEAQSRMVDLKDLVRLDSVEETALNAAYASGMQDGIHRVLEMTYDDLTRRP